MGTFQYNRQLGWIICQTARSGLHPNKTRYRRLNDVQEAAEFKTSEVLLQIRISYMKENQGRGKRRYVARY